MKKKRFLRLSIVSIIILSLGALLFIGGSIYIVVYPFTTDEVFIYGIPRQLYCVFSIILAFFVGIPVFCYEALEFYAGAICLDNEGIRSKGDILGKARKIQYPAFVPYTEIKSIDIIAFCGDSRGGETELYRPIPYLYVVDTNCKTSRFSLHLMSIRSVRLLLEMLDERCAYCGNAMSLDVPELIEKFTQANFSSPFDKKK